MSSLAHEANPHEALLRECRLYRRMWETQQLLGDPAPPASRIVSVIALSDLTQSELGAFEAVAGPIERQDRRPVQD
jgi:hypothetical protein